MLEPPVELKRLVADKGVDARILKDHPHGVDIEINEPDLAYHKRRHAIDICISAKDLLLAFEAITESKEVDAPGEINGNVIESLAKADVPSDEPKWNKREPIAIDQAQAVPRSNPAVQMRASCTPRHSALESASSRRAAPGTAWPVLEDPSHRG